MGENPGLEPMVYKFLLDKVGENPEISISSFVIEADGSSYEVTDAESALLAFQGITLSDGMLSIADALKGAISGTNDSTRSVGMYGKTWSRKRIVEAVIMLRRLSECDDGDGGVETAALFDVVRSKVLNPHTRKTMSNLVNDLEDVGALVREVTSQGRGGTRSVTWPTDTTRVVLEQFENAMATLPKPYLDRTLVGEQDG